VRRRGPFDAPSGNKVAPGRRAETRVDAACGGCPFGQIQDQSEPEVPPYAFGLVTAMGLEPAKWILRMVAWYEEGGEMRGWVFWNKTGGQARASKYEWDVLGELEAIQRESPDIIGVPVNVCEEYRVSRSFQHGSDAHAINQEVDPVDIKENNRWRSVEQAKGRAPCLRMIHHYSDLRQLLKVLL
jgi:hypothetical protein